jgi:electron transfer flavoprotein alpha subunit
MSVIGILLQHTEGKLLKGSLSALEAARQMAKVWSAQTIVGLTLGPGAESAAKEGAAFGIERVLFSEAPELAKYLAPAYAGAVLQFVSAVGVSAVVTPATSVGKDLMPRVAALLDAGQASEIVGVNPDGSLRRPIFAGDILSDVEVVTPKKIVTVRASAFAPATASGSGVVEPLAVSGLPTGMGEVVSVEQSASERPELADAETVVSGGRALGSAEQFQKFIYPLADAFKGAVGASRAAVDSGYAPNDWQVGQTGKVVAPQLYVAVGISGAIQHLAGMKDSKVIVAINKDGDAPIYEVANYGLVADLFQVVPELTEAVKKAKAG